MIILVIVLNVLAWALIVALWRATSTLPAALNREAQTILRRHNQTPDSVSSV